MNHIIKNLKSFVFLLAAISIISCGDENEIPKEYLIEGTISDLSHRPISNVFVKKGDQLLSSSKSDGTFLLEKTQLKEKDVLTFEAEGFATLHRVYEEGKPFKTFMKKRGKAIVIDPNKPQTLEYESGLQLEIPENAFSFKGKKYQEKVKIVTTFFDVTNTLDLISAPGAYIAQNTEEGNLIPLSSYGVVEILAMTMEDEPVELIEEQGIGVKIPLIVEETPNEVNLYILSEETGYWEEKSTLYNENNQLQGVITTVNAAWNADNPCGTQLVCVKVNIQYAGSNFGCYIGATGISYQGFDGFHTPDVNGDVFLMVCPNSVFELGACMTLCCGPGTAPTDPCCASSFAYTTNIDMSSIILNPTGCTDIGTWVVPN